MTPDPPDRASLLSSPPDSGRACTRLRDIRYDKLIVLPVHIRHPLRGIDLHRLDIEQPPVELERIGWTCPFPRVKSRALHIRILRLLGAEHHILRNIGHLFGSILIRDHYIDWHWHISDHLQPDLRLFVVFPQAVD